MTMNKVKKILLIALVVLFPWIVMFLEDKPVSGVVALCLQVTCFGWPIASFWAYGVAKEAYNKKLENSQVRP